MPEKIPNTAGLILALLLAGASATNARESDESRYGAELSTAQVVRIGDILAHPDRYLDKQVKVQGLVDDVCPMKGCWIDILERQSSSTLRFQVQDDVVVFPVTAKGAEVVAEGVLRKHEKSREQAIRWLRHLAEEKGEAFDEKSVTGPMSFYQLEGLGARLQAP